MNHCIDCDNIFGCQRERNPDNCPFFSVTTKPENKYNRRVIGLDGIETTIDVYRVLVAFSVIAPEIQHAAKKILCAGIRGKGSEKQDIDEAILSLKKYQERIEQQETKGDTEK
jgi:hypothetical protein